MTERLAKPISLYDPQQLDETIRVAKRRRIFWLAVHWLLRPFGYLELTDVYKIDLAGLPPLFEIPGYTVSRATADDIGEIMRQAHRGEPPAVIKRLWEEGHDCFVAKANNRVVAYNWIAFTPVQEEEYRYVPRAGDAICVDAYTFPEHRGNKLHLLLLLNMLHFAAASGKTVAYTGASVFNMVSWKTHLRIGWRRGFTFCWFRPYFTPERRPLRLCRERYPLRFDWSRHAWFAAKTSQHRATQPIA